MVNDIIRIHIQHELRKIGIIIWYHCKLVGVLKADHHGARIELKVYLFELEILGPLSFGKPYDAFNLALYLSALTTTLEHNQGIIFLA